MPESSVIHALRGRLIVSCQAWPGDPFAGAETMARFARAAASAGAGGLRANSPADVAAVRAATGLPVIGIQKQTHSDGGILITPTVEAAHALVAAGADIVALDCSARGCAAGALDRLRRIRRDTGVPVMADIATLDEARAAAAAGADLIGSTLRGYTPDTRHVTAFDPLFIAALAALRLAPVIAEGMIWTPEEARAAIQAGAHALVIGSAITRPADIARRFVQALQPLSAAPVIGIDCGGTRIKYGLVSPSGELLHHGSAPTPTGSRDELLGALRAIVVSCRQHAEQAGFVPAACGIATAGWVDSQTGQVVRATANLPSWTGTRLADELREAAGAAVFVANDAHAQALAEHRFGAARGVADFLSLTLGTGVGGGCFSGGRLLRGAGHAAGAIGHLPLIPDGLPCTCGQRGCLEPYANAAALLRYAEGAYADPATLIRDAQNGPGPARSAVASLAAHLARGLAAVLPVLDPELVILSGGLAEDNPILLDLLRSELAGARVRILPSPLGYFSGVIGAGAVAYSAMRS